MKLRNEPKFENRKPIRRKFLFAQSEIAAQFQQVNRK